MTIKDITPRRCMCFFHGTSEPATMAPNEGSLRGRAADVLLAMGSDVSVEQVLAKFDVRFGDVQPSDKALQNFFTARQLPSKSVSVWGCRLEDLLSHVNDPDGVAAARSMLRSRYWSGLYSDQIRNALRHHFDEGADFETLLRQARMAEQEPGSNMAQSLSVQNQDKLDTIMQQLGEMTSKMQDLENKISETEGFPQVKNRNRVLMHLCLIM